MQSRRARIPVVDGPVASAELARSPRPRASPTRDGGRAPPSSRRRPTGEWVVAVGPEGGFDDGRARTASAPAPRLAVGPFVLRAETAAIAAAAALGGSAGDAFSIRTPVASTAESGDGVSLSW